MAEEDGATESAEVWITELDGKFWGVATSLDVAKSFVSGIYQGEWEDVGDGEHEVWKMRARQGAFSVFAIFLMDERLLNMDQEARKKLGIGPT